MPHQRSSLGSHVWAQLMDSEKTNLNQEVMNARDVTALHDGMPIAVTIQMPPGKYRPVLNGQSVRRPRLDLISQITEKAKSRFLNRFVTSPYMKMTFAPMKACFERLRNLGRFC